MRFACSLAVTLFLLLSSVFVSAQTFTTIDFPGATQTDAFGINNLGDVTGFYVGPNYDFHGFLLSGGVFTTADVPGSTFTLAYGINDSKVIVGAYGDSSNVRHSFVQQGASTTTLDYPGAKDTDAYAINNLGVVAGTYLDPVTGYHGFTYNNGTWTTIDGPGQFGTTRVDGINDAGDVVGWFNAGTGFGISGTHVKIFQDGNVPIYYANGINNHGHVIGTGEGQGRSRAVAYGSGTYVTLKDLSTFFPPYMTGQAINDSDSIVGGYQTADQNLHGYLRTVN